MMDGFVAEIREGLDQAGYQNVPIMSYGIKYASSFSVHSEMLQIQHLLLGIENLSNGSCKPFRGIKRIGK